MGGGWWWMMGIGWLVFIGLIVAVVLAFAGACVLASVYGFLQGAWPFGLVEAIWSVVALQRWRRRAI